MEYDRVLNGGPILDKRVVYVGGLTDGTSDNELRDLLGPYGAVACTSVIRHKHSGKSAGYGFVEMGTEEEALRAVVGLEGVLFHGNCLRLFVMPYYSLDSNALVPHPKESLE